MKRPIIRLTAKQSGISALAMVWVLLLVGLLLLDGLQQQVNYDLRNTASEVKAIEQFSLALSAQQWALRLPWQVSANWQCQQNPAQQWRACVRQHKQSAGKDIIIAAQALPSAAPFSASPIILWQRARLTEHQLQPVRHSWSDFCPFSEPAQCILPPVN